MAARRNESKQRAKSEEIADAFPFAGFRFEVITRGLRPGNAFAEPINLAPLG